MSTVDTNPHCGLTCVHPQPTHPFRIQVCEQWWREERGGAEHLVAQTVPYLVARSLEEDARCVGYVLGLMHASHDGDRLTGNHPCVAGRCW